MEKVVSKVCKHQQILTEYLNDLARIENSAIGSPSNCHIITDTIHHQYQLTRIGWHERKYYFSVLMHFTIESDGKIWIQQNNTEVLVGKDLEEKGVDKSDIVVGFRPEYLRAATGYAVA